MSWSDWFQSKKYTDGIIEQNNNIQKKWDNVQKKLAKKHISKYALWDTYKPWLHAWFSPKVKCSIIDVEYMA